MMLRQGFFPPGSLCVAVLILASLQCLIHVVQGKESPLQNEHLEVSTNFSGVSISFSPSEDPFIVPFDESENLTLHCVNTNDHAVLVKLIFTESAQTTKIFVASGICDFVLLVDANSTGMVTQSVTGLTPGKSELTALLYHLQPNLTDQFDTRDTGFKVWVSRQTTFLQSLSITILIAGFSLTNAAWAALLDKSYIREYFISHGRTVVVHLACTFIVKPLLCCAIAAAFRLSAPQIFGVLVLGCSPGTAPSNSTTKFIKGDTMHSIIMTMFSIAFAIVAMPFWVYTLGVYITRDMYDSSWTLHFPWLLIFILQLILIVPAFIAYFVRNCCSIKASQILFWIVRPISLVLVIGGLVMAIYSNIPWFDPLIMDWKLPTCAIVLVLLCYGLGIIGALLARLPLRTIATMSVELGFQNITFVVLINSSILKSPDIELAHLVPVIYALSMLVPAFIAGVVFVIGRKVRGKSGEESTETDEEEKKEEKVTPGDDIVSSKVAEINYAVDIIVMTSGEDEKQTDITVDSICQRL